MTTARALIDYLSGLTLAGGDHDGERFELLPWERRFIRGTFGRGKGGDAALSVGRGNGKSGARGGAGVRGGRPGRSPAPTPRGGDGHRFERSRRRRSSTRTAGRSWTTQLRDRRTWRVQDSQNVATIEHRETGSRIRCLGSDPRRLHGIRPLIVLAPMSRAQWESTKSDKAHAALRTSAWARSRASRLIALGTRPAGESHWFAKLLEGRAVRATPLGRQGRSAVLGEDDGAGRTRRFDHGCRPSGRRSRTKRRR